MTRKGKESRVEWVVKLMALKDERGERKGGRDERQTKDEAKDE